MINHEWKVKSCQYYNQMYGHEGVVFSVIVEVIATNTETNQSNIISQTVGVSKESNSMDFLSIADITPDIALLWVKNSLSAKEVLRIEASAVGSIEMMSEKYFDL